MTESLRDRVEARILSELRTTAPEVELPNTLALVLTDAVFDAMSGARPCVTCGKGIGPAKVDKGYVQCYDCNRRRVEVLPGPITIQLKPTTLRILDAD